METTQAAPARGPVTGERALVVQRFAFTGNTVISEAELQARVAEHLGKPLTIGELFDIADALTAFYRERGYGLANVVLPAQKVDGGTIRFEVVEGRIGRVFIDGSHHYKERRLLRGLRGLESGKVLESETLEREVLLLNDRPGLDARAVIQPGAEYGTSDIVIKVKETPYEFGASLDNYGREVIGEHRLTLDGAVNSLTGRGDRLAGSLVYAEDSLLKYYNLAYGLPVNARGATVTVSANRADYEVGGAFEALGIQGDNVNYRADLSWPLVRTRYANTVFTGAVTRSTTESETALTGEASSSLNYLEAGLFMNRVADDYSAWTANLSYAGNFKGQDVAATDPDGIDSSSMKARLKLDASWSKPFGAWAFVARGSAQWSPDPLPDTQKFAVGGAYTLRGYESSEARGDQGTTLALELQRNLRFWRQSFTVTGFLDAGWVKTEDLTVGVTDVPGDSTSLQSAGLGFAWTSEGRYSAQLQYGQPIGSYESPNDDGGRLWATFGVRF